MLTPPTENCYAYLLFCLILPFKCASLLASEGGAKKLSVILNDKGSGTFADRLKGCQAQDDHDADIFGRLMDRMKVSDFDGDSSHFEVFICYLFVGTHNVF